jgi:hypothetical protein
MRAVTLDRVCSCLSRSACRAFSHAGLAALIAGHCAAR